MRKLQEQGNTITGESFIPTPLSEIQNLTSKIEMREPTADSTISYAVALLNHYGFELRGYRAEELVNLWLKSYPANWVRLAVVEALYQGRYKAVSVEQILAVWTRRGHPIHRFNHEFERLISRKLPQNLAAFLNMRTSDRNLELNLPPLLPSFSDPPTEAKGENEDSSTFSLTSQPPIAEGEPLPSTPMPTEELLQMSIELDAQPSEVLTTGSGENPYPEMDWSRCELNRKPIDQFTPSPDSSDFYLKLKAVVQQQVELPPQNLPLSTEEREQQPPHSNKN